MNSNYLLEKSYRVLLLDEMEDYEVAIDELSRASIEWARSFYEAMRPHLAGKAFPNLMGQDEMADREKQAYGANSALLAGIKEKYDPTNFFH